MRDSEWFHGVDFREVRLRFLDINRERLEMVQSTLSQNKQRFLHLLPLLFHINHPMLPGYVSSRCPSGISNYRPDKRTQEEAQVLAKSFQLPRGALQEDIHGLYLMGSAGTLAFSSKSDLDIWICHEPDLESEALALLQQKARLLEIWAESLSLEVHFFLINAETFRHGSTEALSDESSGSAQHVLLLEEFYRTGILLVGRYPIWWLVPPSQESYYKEAVEDILEKRFIHEHEVIDFGGLGNLPAEEFFGAAVWQLSKGINSPYKSALKIMLAECYASEYPNVKMLGMQFKQAVHDGVGTADKLDPYLMLHDRLDGYLRSQDAERLQLMRQAFYLKVRASLSKKAPENEHWRYEVMQTLASRWGWSDQDILHLDTRDQWKADVVEAERKTVIQELTRSYQALSDFARRLDGGSRISKQDLTILGRKLFAAFERKVGKIDIINRGIAKDLSETHLTIHQFKNADNKVQWLLFRGQVPVTDIDHITPLKRGRSLIELLSWCYFNDVMSSATNLSVFRMGHLYPQEEAMAIYKSLEKHFSIDELNEPHFEDISAPPSLSTSVLFVNHNVPATELPSSKAVPRGNSNFDAFSYSGLYFNLVRRIDWVFTSSWGEIYCFSYFDVEGIADCLGEYLERLKNHNNKLVPDTVVYAFSPEYASVISGRMEQLWRDLGQLYSQEKMRLGTRYLMAVEKQYLLLQYANDLPLVKRVDSYSSLLLRALSQPNPRFINLKIDSYTLTQMPLPFIYRYNRPDRIQIFYLERNENKIDIYILDECGSLHFQSSQLYNAAILMSHYIEFIDAVIKRINMETLDFSDEFNVENSLDLYQVKRSGDKGWEIGRRILRERRAQQETQITAICDSIEGDEKSYRIYCGEKEFSTLQYGQSVYEEVAREVIAMRKDNIDYPIHVSDIDITFSLLDSPPGGRLQTIHYLNHKRYLELRLNRALESL
ncbi:MAG: class I adenylate cyclase [Gammaproteobacteria bacterium]|nr:class I adenylate cyclase [Gammaproteobacteria bacterium]